jgi:hypothetical protein
MKSSRLPKHNIIKNIKLKLSCCKNKNSSKKINLVCSKDNDDNVVCRYCKTLFFSKNEMKQLNKAYKKILPVYNRILQLEEDLRCAISNVYDNVNVNVNIIDLYVRQPNVMNQEEFELERNKINAQILQLIQRKCEKYEEFKHSVGLTEHDEILLTKFHHIKNTSVSNCDHDCHFRR